MILRSPFNYEWTHFRVVERKSNFKTKLKPFTRKISKTKDLAIFIHASGRTIKETTFDFTFPKSRSLWNPRLKYNRIIPSCGQVAPWCPRRYLPAVHRGAAPLKKLRNASACAGETGSGSSRCNQRPRRLGDVSIGWKTIGSRYAKPQPGDRPLPLGRQPLARRLFPRGNGRRRWSKRREGWSKKKRKRERERRWWNSRRSRKWEESGGDTTEIKKKEKKRRK